MKISENSLEKNKQRTVLIEPNERQTERGHRGNMRCSKQN